MFGLHLLERLSEYIGGTRANRLLHETVRARTVHVLEALKFKIDLIKRQS